MYGRSCECVHIPAPKTKSHCIKQQESNPCKGKGAKFSLQTGSQYLAGPTPFLAVTTSKEQNNAMYGSSVPLPGAFRFISASRCLHQGSLCVYISCSHSC
ncbi:hypothetical protein L249_8528 [Ophiocordyceps polyrhachis-furcata BCC 54312]|uniref:Uncharacterized protein n=1 Tax=Ophiocordyceps polyrhachis-furcata BCC 54312 TaxID=1330021 RepID=A0A367L7N8_9HYPO|nr:hypothetical protein L249_8528 [Ophiocordyceps polyrhachis-furcata BCC 54312]